MDLTFLDAASEEPDAVAEEQDNPHFRPRRGARFALDEAAQLRSQSGNAVEVKVHDISTSGFMATCLRPVLINSYVTLDMPGIGPVHAQVRWQVGGKLGARFLDPVSLDSCSWTTTRLAR